MRIIFTATLICAVMSMSVHAAPTKNHCLYLSPVPHARLVSSSTGIIMRFDLPVASASLSDSCVRVVGSSSGAVTGSLRLSDDEVTVLFKPVHAFAPGETVHVRLGGGLFSKGGVDLGQLDWDFSVSPTGLPVVARDFLTTLREEVAQAAPSSALDRSELFEGDPDPPKDFPSVTVSARNEVIPGALFLSSFTMDPRLPYAPYLIALKDVGTPSFMKKVPAFCFDFKRQDNGLYTFFQGDSGYFMCLDSAFRSAGSYRAGHGYTTDGHELRILPNGHVLLLAADAQTVDMSALVKDGSPNATVLGNVIQELDRAGDVVFEWRSFDHFRITDATLTNFQDKTIDAVHSNALELDADGNILLSSRHLDEITKIDRTTGAIIWRWGGRNNQFAFLGSTLPFSHQHAIRRLPNGHYTLFDNGNGHVPAFSRALEYELDTAAMTATVVWQYVRPYTYAPAMGNVQRLENGNTLIGWGSTSPAATIVSPAGTIVYELLLPAGVYSYRVYNLPWETSATAVGGTGAEPAAYSLDQNYPNPFNPTTTIQFAVPRASRVTLSVTNTLGQHVATLIDGEVEAGAHAVQFDGSGLSSGVYFYRLDARPAEPESAEGTGEEEGVFVGTKELLLLR